MSDTLWGAIVGGAIGLISALAVAGVSVIWNYRHDQYRREFEAHRDYLSWLRGLIPECEFIIFCINQLQPMYDGMAQGGELFCPTKELNSDFLAAARLGIIKHPRGSQLFPSLTAAYRDVLQTNGMILRFERKYRELVAAENLDLWPKISGVLLPTAKCMPSVRASVEALLAAAREQEQLESMNPPLVWSWGI